jgi:putative flippase GtrA
MSGADLGITAAPSSRSRDTRRLAVEVVVPVYNEERVLATNVRRLHGYLSARFPYRFLITIADNASTDDTWRLAQALAGELPHVRAVHLDRKGRGQALRVVWADSEAEVVSYMDVDLSTDLDAFLPLVAPLLSGHSDLSIGTRLARGSMVVRGPKREFVSRTYNLILRLTTAARFSDAQCGFKAGRTEIIRALLPAVEDQGWFFDTELLLLAEVNGLRIHEVPVDWVDDPDSRVDIVKTAWEDLRGIARFARRSLSGAVGRPVPRRLQQARLPTGMKWQIPSFAVIGVLSTLAYLLLYLVLRSAMSAVAANAIALAVTAIANTAANRRFTFGVTGGRNALRDQLGGGIAFLVGLGLSSGSLGLLHTVEPHPSRPVEVVALVFANALATLARFLLLRAWVFHPRRRSGRGEATPAAAPAASPTRTPASKGHDR